MSRLSRTFLPTLKDPPAEAEAISHKLMVRAGLIRQLGAGIWSYLPAGWRVHRKVEAIIREEMDAIGAQEMLMPVLMPAENWKKTGRYAIDELFKLKDRKGSDMVLAMTHEEAVTQHVANEVRSYRDLPLILYHLQTKERDEPRPRAGVLRTREFTMKDAYSFDRDQEGLDRSYQLNIEAYDKIYDRCGLRWYRCASDVGMMGGSDADEYMAPCDAGEDDIALSKGYSANTEVASATPQPVELPGPLEAPERVETPGKKTIAEVGELLGLPAGAMIKALPVMVEDRGLVMALVRGDHKLNEIKLKNHLGAPFRPASEDEMAAEIGPAGFAGPIAMKSGSSEPGSAVPVLMDTAIDGDSYVCGANEVDAHLRGVNPSRDFEAETADIRMVEAGDAGPEGDPIEIVPAIEIGNIFKLGTRYTEPLGATFLSEDGKEQPIVMGCYGIGPARILAAAIEQGNDEAGIVWPKSIAPWQIHLVSLGKTADSEEAQIADKIYDELQANGVEVVYDDRDQGPGAKLKDAELLGCPLRITVGKKVIADGEVEVQVRKGRENSRIPIDGAAAAAVAMLAELD